MKKLICLALLCVSAWAQIDVMTTRRRAAASGTPPSYVKSASGICGGTTCTATFTGNVTSGNIIAVWVGWASTTYAASIADTRSNSYTALGNPTVCANASGFLAYATANATDTVAVTLTTSDSTIKSIIVHEISGSSGFDSGKSALNCQTGGSTPGTGTDAVTSGSVTPSVNDTYIFGGTLDAGANGRTFTAGTNYTTRETQTGAGQTLRSEDRQLTTAGAVAATFTLNADTSTLTGLMVFKP